MNGPVWTQILVGFVVGAPLLAVLGAAVTFAVGGIIGCTECLFSRFSDMRMPGVVNTHHHGHIAAGA